MSPVTLALRPEDARPILRKAAYDAARLGGLLDHVPRRIYGSPARNDYERSRVEWREGYLSAKRIVEAFGIEVERIEGTDLIGPFFPHTKGGKRTLESVGSLRFYVTTGAKTDHSRPERVWKGSVFAKQVEDAALKALSKWEALVGLAPAN